MKSKFTTLISFLGLLLIPAHAFAHLPSLDPYGYPDYVLIQPECPLGNLGYQGDQAKNRARSDFCSSVEFATHDAEEAHSKEVCSRLKGELANRFQNGKTWPFDFSLEGKIDEAIKMCSGSVSAAASLVHPSSGVKKFDQNLIYVTSFLGLVYLLLALILKNVRNWKTWILPIIFQIVISFAMVFIGAISQIPLEGPPVPALHNFLVFQQRYLLRIIVTGVITSLATLVMISLFLLSYRQELSAQDRKKIALFYTLVFNPFFFPVGIIFGLMNLIFLKRTRPSIQVTNAAPPAKK